MEAHNVNICIHSFIHSFFLSFFLSSMCPLTLLFCTTGTRDECRTIRGFLNPDDDEDQQNGMASEIETNCIPPNPEEEGEEWFWV
jgi:hypothetical protein